MGDRDDHLKNGLVSVQGLRAMQVTEAQRNHSISRELVLSEQHRFEMAKNELSDRQREAARGADPGQIIDIAARGQCSAWLTIGEQEVQKVTALLNQAVEKEMRTGESLTKCIEERAVLDRLLERRLSVQARNQLRSQYRILDDLVGVTRMRDKIIT